MEQVYSHCRVSVQSDKPDVSDVSDVLADGAFSSRSVSSRQLPLSLRYSAVRLRGPAVAVALTLAGLAASPVAADDADVESASRSTVAQVWGYAQGVTQNITQGVAQEVASWFGRGEQTAEPRPAEARRPESGTMSGTTSVTLSPDLMLEAFPALARGSSEDTLRILDGSQEMGGTELGFGPGQAARESDLNASYVWESARFGQFILSTNTGYQARGRDHLLEGSQVSRTNDSGASAFGSNNLTGIVPELQSSFTFTWQIGNHTATAVTTYADALDGFNGLPSAQINIEQLNELVGQMGALDLRYGYSVRTGRQSSASISVGVRNMFDRRALLPGTTGVSSRLTEPSRVAYGSIKYQF